MSGTLEGGRRARETNLARDPEFYARIGKKGGKVKVKKGFGVDRRSWIERLLGVPKLAERAGKKGGYKSKRGPAKKY